MSQLKTLLKVDLINSFSLNKLNKRHSTKTSKKPLLTTIILSIVMFLFVCFYSLMIGILCNEVGQLESLLTIGVFGGSLLCFVTSISKANGILFESKDFDLLISMPINTKTIITSKLISLLLLNYMNFALLFIPTAAVYALFATPSIMFYIISIIVFITGPMLIVTVCSFLSFVIGIVLSKVKQKAVILSVFTMVLFVAFFIVYMGFIMKLQVAPTDDESFEQVKDLLSSMNSNLQSFYPPVRLAVSGMTGNYLNLLFYLILSIVPFGLFIVVVSKNYLRANIRARITYTVKNFQLTELKSSGQIKTLLKKEFKRFFSSSTYLMNCGLSPIMSVILFVVGVSSLNTATSGEAGDMFNNIIPLISIVFAGFAIGIAPTTSASINIEGKNFWILKTAPIKTQNVFIAKCLLNIIICVPFAIVNSILGYFIASFSILDCILFLLVEVALIVMYTLEGLWVNILTPKLDWDNEVKAIKQGTGPLLSLLISIVIGIAVYVPGIIIGIVLPINGLIVMLFMAIIGVVIMGLILFTHGKNKYEKITV